MLQSGRLRGDGNPRFGGHGRQGRARAGGRTEACAIPRDERPASGLLSQPLIGYSAVKCLKVP